MKIYNKIAICVALNAVFITSAYAIPIVQTTLPTNLDNYSWGFKDLGTIQLMQGTNSLLALSSSAIVFDQGWGGYDPFSNGVYVGLFVNGVNLYNEKVADLLRGNNPAQTYDISTHPTSLFNFNSFIGAIDWAPNTTANIEMFANLQAYGGWQEHVRDASFSITTAVESVPEPTSIALLVMGLLSFCTLRRKIKKTQNLPNYV